MTTIATSHTAANAAENPATASIAASDSVDLILASSSPRRQSFFHALGLSFRTLTADVDETPLEHEGPIELVARLAAAKAAAVAARVQSPPQPAAQVVIVAADTTVARDATILNKPDDAADAMRMLQSLRGVPHQVHSAIAVRTLDPNSLRLRVNTTTVHMRNYTDAEIAAYIATGDPLDKAGAYGLQHPRFAPAAALEGCLAGVVGLPLSDLVALLQEFNIEVKCALAPICEAQAPFACCARRPS